MGDLRPNVSLGLHAVQAYNISSVKKKKGQRCIECIGDRHMTVLEAAQ